MTEPVKKVFLGGTAVEAGVNAGKAAGKAIKENYQNLAKVISGKKSVKEAVKDYKHPGIEAGRALGKTVAENHKKTGETVRNIFKK